MAHRDSIGLDAYRVPCPVCSETMTGTVDANGFFEPCRVLDKTVRRTHSRRGSSVPLISTAHRKRVALARQWVGAGKPDLRAFIRIVRLLIWVQAAR